MIKVVDVLIEKGFIYHSLGSQEKKEISFFWPTPTLTTIITGSQASPERINKEVIQIKEKGKLKDYAETHITTRQRDLVNYYNIRLEKSVFIDHTRKQLSTRSLFNVRIFNDNFSFGGRFYAPWQNVRKADRRLWTIDGQSIVEIDYTATHARLAYAQVGMVPPNDPYGYVPNGVNPTDARLLCKMVFQYLMNCRSRKSATFTLEEFQKKKFGRVITPSSTLITSMMTHTKDIKDLFFKSHGLRLQAQDAAIAENIISVFLAADKPVLTLHDSFLVRASDREFLRTTMESCWFLATGQPAALKEV